MHLAIARNIQHKHSDCEAKVTADARETRYQASVKDCYLSTVRQEQVYGESSPPWFMSLCAVLQQRCCQRLSYKQAIFVPWVTGRG